MCRIIERQGTVGDGSKPKRRSINFIRTFVRAVKIGDIKKDLRGDAQRDGEKAKRCT